MLKDVVPLVVKLVLVKLRAPVPEASITAVLSLLAIVNLMVRSVLSPVPVYFNVGATLASAMGVDGCTKPSKVASEPPLLALSAVITRFAGKLVDAPMLLATPPFASLPTDRMP